MSNELIVDEENFLEHFGVKGMKWGIRKDKTSSGGKSKPASKTVKSLSDEELRTRVKRLNLEKQYVDLVSQENKRNQGILSKGRQAVGEIVGNIAKNSLTNYGTSVAGEVLKAVVTPALKKALKTAEG